MLHIILLAPAIKKELASIVGEHYAREESGLTAQPESVHVAVGLLGAHMGGLHYLLAVGADCGTLHSSVSTVAAMQSWEQCGANGRGVFEDFGPGEPTFESR